VPKSSLKVLWYVYYWTSFVATYLIFPVMSKYVKIPDFGPIAKFKRIGWENLILFSVGGAVLLIGMIALLATGTFTFQRLFGIAMFISNLFSLTLIMIFLGYGLATVPKKIWRRGNLELTLRRLK
tara:strand:- start:610 stop:984 length:375 start_codon:yes stop_codon:yes gene_type:complete